MALQHAKPGEVIDIRPLGTGFQEFRTTTLIKTDSLELIRLVLPAGKVIPPHAVPGEVTVQCLEGHVAFEVGTVEHELKPGDLLLLSGSEQHALRAVEDSSLLASIVLAPPSS